MSDDQPTQRLNISLSGAEVANQAEELRTKLEQRLKQRLSMAQVMKRLIQKDVVNALSKKILAGDVDKSHPVLVDVFDGVVVIRNNGNTPAGEAEADKED